MFDDKHDDDSNEDASTTGLEGFGTIDGDGRYTNDLKDGNRGNGFDELLLLWSSTVATGAAATTAAAEDNGRSR